MYLIRDVGSIHEITEKLVDNLKNCLKILKLPEMQLIILKNLGKNALKSLKKFYKTLKNLKLLFV